MSKKACDLDKLKTLNEKIGRLQRVAGFTQGFASAAPFPKPLTTSSSKLDREMDKLLKLRNESYERLLSEDNFYMLPVIMGICTFTEVKKMYKKDLLLVRKAAKEKLDREFLNSVIKI